MLAIVINVVLNDPAILPLNGYTRPIVLITARAPEREAKLGKMVENAVLPWTTVNKTRRIHFGEDVDGEKCSTTRIPFVSPAI